MGVGLGDGLGLWVGVALGWGEGVVEAIALGDALGKPPGPGSAGMPPLVLQAETAAHSAAIASTPNSLRNSVLVSLSNHIG